MVSKCKVKDVKDPSTGGEVYYGDLMVNKSFSVSYVSTKCSERGCAFPAQEGANYCRHHEVERREPQLFQSISATQLMCAELAIVDSTPD